MTIDRERAAAFVDGYGRTWQSWDIAGFVDLFTDDVKYVEHPTGKTVVGRDALDRYIRSEEAAQGAVTVRMGKPVIDGNHVAAEFWAVAADAAIPGCFIARLDPTDGRCIEFREYWFDVEGPASPFDGWGE